ncbi:MAG TPA: fibronectin type III domain-containing protein [Candidatus Limnocylindrales bacterium]|nr:fibronectin type III domain-containing protein [Candidatus Limnocylindrales bacterium]
MATTSSVLGTQSVTLAWNPVTNANVAGYNIYYGSASGNYTNVISVGNVTNATISGLTEGATYYFATTTLSTSGLESAYSSEISYTVPVPNGVPGIQVTPGSIGFGTVLAGTSVTNKFVVQNAGTGTLSGSASVSGPFSVVSGGSYSLGAGQTQAVVVVFSPLAANNYTQSVSFSVSVGTGMNVTVSGSATNVSSATVPSPPSVITRTITADTTNLITLQFTTNLTSPTWQTLGVLAGSTNLSFTNMPAVFLRGVCNNLTGSVTLTWPPSTDPMLLGYIIFSGTASQTYNKAVTVGKVTTATISNLTIGKTYYFKVMAYDSVLILSLALNEISAVPQATGFSLTFTGP